jgi:hypothetical protein
LILSLAVASCEDEATGTNRSTRTPLSASPSGVIAQETGSGSIGSAAAVQSTAADSGVGALGTLPLPVNQTFSSSGVALRIVQTGAGPNANFVISNPASMAPAALQGNSNGIGAAVRGQMTGNGRAGLFEISNAGSTSDAVRVFTSGLGRALYGETSGRGGPAAEFVLSNSTSLDPAVRASTAGSGNALEATASGSSSVVLGINFGTGPAGQFDIRNNANSSPALRANSDGSGAALNAISTGTGHAGLFQVINSASLSNALEVHHDGGGNSFSAGNFGTGSAGAFNTNNASSTTQTLFVSNSGNGQAGLFWSSNPNSGGNTLKIQNDGLGTALDVQNFRGAWAAQFSSNQLGLNGVYISTLGGQGLQVVGGAKNAVVGTSDGARALYTEESTEVWFTDYGFGRLTNGRAYVALDAKFAETVSLDAPYHVFVQPYGDAELYVAQRTATGFEVVRRGGDKRVEFSYRIVARRKGFEGRRLERAPWADDDPALSPRLR